MGTQLSRILTDGLISGVSATTLANEMVRSIGNITRTRAYALARTEIIYAHAEGQLDSFQALGIKEVSAKAEWSTAGDALVCPQCSPMEGVVLTIKEARGLIPLHPNCRCMWIPADVGEKKTGQLWGKRRTRAIKKSSKAAHG
jgi:SPP1 gp7 family putative phage head morphogenesis protein